MQHLIKTLLAAVVLLALSVTSQAEVTVTYLHTNGLGSVVAASDEGGDLLWRKVYMPYGTIHENGQAKNPAVGYTGHVQDDDTGLTYMGARYYDPELGRFLQMDPASVLDNVESNPMMFNRYTYANGNPYRFIDPDGRSPKNRDGGHAANLGGAILVGLGFRTSENELLAQGIILPDAKGTSKAKRNPKKPVRASDLDKVKPDTKDWNSAVADLKELGKEKRNYRTETAGDAKRLLQESRGNMDRQKQYTDNNYRKGYETHNDQNDRERGAGNDLQHIKWKDGKSGGHIYYDKPN
ncbi:RHS repeat-associated core domain-containing protein [Microbulbifer sp. ZKSA004]|uniref:RHS repeat-associated core domain-containing protein n=1 Tax=Microbulbifer sp. ZKSA004 TaxID=3243389 RepID=UPI00403A538A